VPVLDCASVLSIPDVKRLPAGIFAKSAGGLAERDGMGPAAFAAALATGQSPRPGSAADFRTTLRCPPPPEPTCSNRGSGVPLHLSRVLFACRAVPADTVFDLFDCTLCGSGRTGDCASGRARLGPIPPGSSHAGWAEPSRPPWWVVARPTRWTTGKLASGWIAACTGIPSWTGRRTARASGPRLSIGGCWFGPPRTSRLPCSRVETR
jgi:hypothetical protein